jgi:hypothetical protein
MRKGDRYNFEVFEGRLDGLVRELSGGQDLPPALRALHKLKLGVIAQAIVEEGLMRPGAQKDLLLSYAWEDAVIAFSGYGGSGLTGLIIELWCAIPEDKWPEFRAGLNRAKVTADEKTSMRIPRSYLLLYRRQTVRSPDEGLNYPALVPARGQRLREWASGEGMNPAKVEEVMAELEELERIGVYTPGEESKEMIKLQTAAGVDVEIKGESDGGDLKAMRGTGGTESKGTVLSFPRGGKR